MPRCQAYAGTRPNSHARSHRYAYANTIPNSNSNRHSNVNTNTDAHRHRYTYAYPDTHSPDVRLLRHLRAGHQGQHREQR